MTMSLTLPSAQAKLFHPLAGAVELEVDAAIIEEKKLDLTSCILPAIHPRLCRRLEHLASFPFSIIDGKFLEYLQIF